MGAKVGFYKKLLLMESATGQHEAARFGGQ